MILRSLRVEGWRCFADAVEIGPLVDRINVVHGPNGSGKSTLLWAMIRALMDNHASRGAAIEALRPNGRRLTPRVIVELEHDGRRLRIAKQFLDSPRSEISREEGGRFVPLAEGRAADDFLRGLLEADVPGHGLSSEKHWGLAQVLWAPQGRLELPELAGNVAGAIRASLGSQMTDPAADAVEQKIQEAYGRVFTEKTGKLRSGAEATRLEKELDERRRRRDELQIKYDQFESFGRQVVEADRRRDELAAAESRLAEELKTAVQQAEAFNQLRLQCDRQTNESAAAKARYDQLKTLLDAQQTEQNNQREAAEALARLDADVPRLKETLETLLRQEAEAAAERETVGRRQELVERLRQKADLAARFCDARARLARREKTLAEADQLHAEADRLAGQRAKIVAPDARRLRAIQAAARRRDEIRAAVAASMISVRIEPESDLSISVEKAETPGVLETTKGQTIELTGSPTVEFRIAGVGRFHAAGPTGSIDSLREEQAAVEQELMLLVEGMLSGTSGEACLAVNNDLLARLEAAHDEAAALDRQIEQAKARLLGLLGESSLDSLRQEGRATADQVAQIELEEPGWATASPDPEALRVGAQSAQREYEASRLAAETRRNEAQKARAEAEKSLALAESQRQTQREKLDRALRRLEELASVRSGQDADGGSSSSGDDLNAGLDHWAMQYRAAQAELAKTREQLAHYADDPNRLIARLEKELADIRESIRQNRDQCVALKTRLDALAQESPYSALVEAEEATERLAESLAAERLRNDAVRLLFETFRDCRDEAVQSVIAPVERRATDLLRRIAGRPLGPVALGESFLPERFAAVEGGEPLALEHASGGEQEQIHLAVRLALAETLGGDRRRLVVLDDALTDTDPARLGRALGLFEEMADRFQLLILTCQPNRYAALGEARFFELK